MGAGYSNFVVIRNAYLIGRYLAVHSNLMDRPNHLIGHLICVLLSLSHFLLPLHRFLTWCIYDLKKPARHQ